MANDSDSTNTDAGKRAGGARGALAYWGPPIAIGLAVGLALAWIWRVGGIGRTPVDEIVERWEWGAHEENAELARQIAALGPSARADVVDAFLSVPDDYPDLKVWVAERLTEEPFFDNKSLVDAARGNDPWARRAACVALALRLREEADLDVVMPGLLDWLTDLTTDDHELAVLAVVALGPLPTEWETRVREALLVLGRRRPPASGDPEDDWTPEDRELVIQQGLSRYVSTDDADKAVVDLLHEILVDEEDDYGPRVAAVRVLSEKRVLDRFDAWKAAGASQNVVVRQAVADNLFRTNEREFGEILKPLHRDESSLVRGGSLDSQIMRRQPTMLDILDELLEDHDRWVRFAATEAAAAFRDAPEPARRAAMLLRLMAESEDPQDVTGAVLALYAMTNEVHGFRDVDVHAYTQEIEESALEAFMKDPEGRAEAVQRYRAKFGGVTFTKDDRIAVLEKLLEHPDPENRERAAKLLAELR